MQPQPSRSRHRRAPAARVIAAVAAVAAVGGAAAAQSPFADPQVLGTRGRVHDNMISTVAFTADGSRAMTVAWDWKVKFWDAATGAQVAELEASALPMAAGFCGADGARVALLELEVGLRFVEVATKRELTRIEGEFAGVGFRADGAGLAAMGRDGRLRLFDAAGAAQGEIEVGKGFDTPRFSADGSKLLVNSVFGKKVALVDPAAGKVEKTVELPGLSTRQAFLPDGESFVAGVGQSLLWISFATGEELGRWGWDASVSALAVLGDRLVAFGDGDGAIAVFDLAAGELGGVVHEHADTVSGLAVQPGGALLLSGSHDQWVRFWRLPDLAMALTVPGHNGRVGAVACGADGLVLSGAADNSVAIWRGGELVHGSTPHENSITAAAAAPDGTLWTTSYDGRLRHTDAAGKELGVIQLGEGEPPAFVLTPLRDGTLIAGHADGSLRWYRDGAEVEDLRRLGHESPVLHLVSDGDGGRVCVGHASGSVVVWDVAASAIEAEFEPHEDGVSGLVLVGDVLFSSGYDRKLRRYDLDAGEVTHEITVGTEDCATPGGLAWCAGRDLVVTASADMLRAFAGADLAPRGESAPMPATPTAIAAAAKGDAVATAMVDGTVVVWPLR